MEITPAAYSVPTPSCSLFFTIRVIQKSVVVNQLRNHLFCKLGCLPSPTLKPFSSSLPIFSFYHQALYFPALPCLLEQIISFLFLLPKCTCREVCSVSQQLLVTAEDITWAFSLSVLAMPGAVLSAAVSLLHSQMQLRHKVGGKKEPSSSPSTTAQLFSALHLHIKKTNAFHPVSGYLCHIQKFVVFFL